MVNIFRKIRGASDRESAKSVYGVLSETSRLHILAMAITVILCGGLAQWGESQIPLLGSLPGLAIGGTLLHFISSSASIKKG